MPWSRFPHSQNTGALPGLVPKQFASAPQLQVTHHLSGREFRYATFPMLSRYALLISTWTWANKLLKNWHKNIRHVMSPSFAVTSHVKNNLKVITGEAELMKPPELRARTHNSKPPVRSDGKGCRCRFRFRFIDIFANR